MCFLFRRIKNVSNDDSPGSRASWRGVRLFDNLEKQIKLEQTKIIEAPGVTHLQFLLKGSSR
jgi:hypothetical protein